MNEEQLAWIKSLIRDELDRVFMPELKALQAEIVRLTLTDAEREAVEYVTNNFQRLCDEYAPMCESDENTLATLRGLLERLK